jgi:integrase
MPSITKAAADRLKVKSGRKYVFDASYPGLALRVSDSGRKTWVYCFRLKNGAVKQRRHILGVYPAMGVEQAHEAWRKAYDLVQVGRDPAVAETSLPPKSFESVLEEWLRLDQGDNRSAAEVKQRFHTHCVPSWKGRLITDIDKRACLAVIDHIHGQGKVALARRMFSHLHRLFVWCVSRGIVETNPLLHVGKPGSETPRERVLSDAELVKVWTASDQLAPAWRDAFRLLILTGARKSEISNLQWDEIKDGAIHLEGERTKNGKPHVISLSTAARSILGEPKNGAVFPRVSSNWSRPKRDLDEISGVTEWTIHDLRRTVATGLQKQGVPLVVTEAILGHTSGSRAGIVGVYQKHDYADEKRAALEAWGAHVIALIEGSPRGKVIAWGR